MDPTVHSRKRPSPGSPFYLPGPAFAAADNLDHVLDEIAASVGVVRLRAWARRTLGVRPGETVVDVGAGNGTHTQILAAAAGPSGRAVGVEPHENLRQVAVLRSAERGSRAEFIDGNALALPFADASVDVVWCERVLQHLDESDRAVAEIARVLRPGGRVALLDTDWATYVVSPGDPDTVSALAKSAAMIIANPYSGRRLGGQLTKAGLVVDDMGSQASMRTHRDIRWPSLRKAAERAVRTGLATPQQMDELMAGLVDAAADKTLHCSVTMFSAVAHRPTMAHGLGNDPVTGPPVTGVGESSCPKA